MIKNYLKPSINLCYAKKLDWYMKSKVIVHLNWLRIYQTKMSITQDCNFIVASYFDKVYCIIRS